MTYNETSPTTTDCLQDDDFDCFLADGCDMTVDLGSGIGIDFIVFIDEIQDPLNRYTLQTFYDDAEVTRIFESLMGDSWKSERQNPI